MTVDVAAEVADVAFATGLAEVDRPADLRSQIEDAMYRPHYLMQV